jgi:aspartyl-tRNA(Asn)/glutamyl-tRNA(Gln) amidotransferase subunit B
MEHEKVIGLEIHMRIKSQTKLFCACKNALELETQANVNVCPVCMWFPGMLPAVNAEVIKLWVVAGMMRKSYFYPDLPNSFQTTQLYEPIVGAWNVETIVEGKLQNFWIHHMHLENDAGKLSHAWGKTLCDYNRAGSPLMEIVTDPVFRSREEVMEFLKELQKMMRAAWVSDADMEKGQMRCDVNMSIREAWTDVLNNRTEHKNVNSFSAIGRCIDSEYKRQKKIVEKWGEVNQETRGWDDATGTSSSQRSKEDAMDYRYVPEPDILPIELSDELLASAKAQVVELPIKKRIKYLEEYKLWEDDARILTADYELSEYFDELVTLTKDAKKSCSILTTVILALMNDSEDVSKISDLKFDLSQLAKVITLTNADELSSTNAKLVIEELFEKGGDTDDIVDAKNLRQKNDMWALESIVDEVIENNPEQVSDYKWGNERIFGFLVWQCMKASKWQWNPKVFNEILKGKLD